MRKLILIILSISIPCVFYAQNPPVQNDMKPNDFNNVKPTTFEDYLVQMAWTSSPETEGARYEIDARTQEVQLAKKDWTRNLQAALNFNDVSFPYFLRYNLGVERIGGRAIDTSRFSRIATYPLWQVGIGLNFGDVITR